MNQHDYNQKRRNFTNAALNKMKGKLLPSSTSHVDLLFTKLEHLVADVKTQARPIQQAGGAVKPFDEQNLRFHIFGWTLERLKGLSKDELEIFATTILADGIMNDVKADPWGTGSPDLLAGQ